MASLSDRIAQIVEVPFSSQRLIIPVEPDDFPPTQPDIDDPIEDVVCEPPCLKDILKCKAPPVPVSKRPPPKAEFLPSDAIPSDYRPLTLEELEREPCLDIGEVVDEIVDADGDSHHQIVMKHVRTKLEFFTPPQSQKRRHGSDISNLTPSSELGDSTHLTAPKHRPRTRALVNPLVSRRLEFPDEYTVFDEIRDSPPPENAYLSAPTTPTSSVISPGEESQQSSEEATLPKSPKRKTREPNSTPQQPKPTYRRRQKERFPMPITVYEMWLRTAPAGELIKDGVLTQPNVRYNP